MKYIITEEQIETSIKKLSKDKTVEGKLSKVIEELTLSFLEDKEICDIAVTLSNNNYHFYMILILTPEWLGYKADKKIEKYIEDFLGIGVMVIIAESKDCERIIK
jgi:hypothetical protein